MVFFSVDRLGAIEHILSFITEKGYEVLSQEGNVFLLKRKGSPRNNDPVSSNFIAVTVNSDGIFETLEGHKDANFSDLSHNGRTQAYEKYKKLKEKQKG